MTNVGSLKDIVDRCLENGEWSWEDDTTISLDGTNIKLKIEE